MRHTVHLCQSTSYSDVAALCGAFSPDDVYTHVEVVRNVACSWNIYPDNRCGECAALRDLAKLATLNI